jgi:uncharacterized iron-regulated membrane protein
MNGPVLKSLFREIKGKISYHPIRKRPLLSSLLLKEKLRVFLDNHLINTFIFGGESLMKRLGRLHFLVGILVSVLLMAQAVIGIMMYVDGSGTEPMNQQAVMGQPADRNTTETDDTEESANSSTAADDSSTETASNDTQGTSQGGPNGSGTPGEMPNGGGFQGRDSFEGKFIDFYQGAGGLAASIFIFVIGGAGLATTMISRKTAA